MSPVEIEQKLTEAKQKEENEVSELRKIFWNRPYGKDVPTNFMANFKKAIAKLSPQQDKMFSEQLLTWISLPQNDWSFAQVHRMCEVIGTLSRESISLNMEKALKYHLEIEHMLMGMGSEIEAENNSLMERKRNFEESMAQLVYKFQNEENSETMIIETNEPEEIKENNLQVV